MNKVFLIGRLTRDPELRYGANNMAVMRSTIAVDRQYQSQSSERSADFISITAFAQRAEVMKKYLVKGSQIAIDGRIQTGSYDGADGKRVYTTDVIVDNFKFLDSKGSRNIENQQQEQSQDIVTPYDFSNNTPSSTTNIDPFKDFGDKIEIDDSDLPF